MTSDAACYPSLASPTVGTAPYPVCHFRKSAFTVLPRSCPPPVPSRAVTQAAEVVPATCPLNASMYSPWLPFADRRCTWLLPPIRSVHSAALPVAWCCCFAASKLDQCSRKVVHCVQSAGFTFGGLTLVRTHPQPACLLADQYLASKHMHNAQMAPFEARTHNTHKCTHHVCARARVAASHACPMCCLCRVLDAPALQDDFYLNMVDWSSQNVLAVGLGPSVYLWSASTSNVGH
eukprot:1160316-Pelagomonas_calceolata.AAC.5